MAQRVPPGQGVAPHARSDEVVLGSQVMELGWSVAVGRQLGLFLLDGLGLRGDRWRLCSAPLQMKHQCTPPAPARLLRLTSRRFRLGLESVAAGILWGRG